jgi:hypothetical protein
MEIDRPRRALAFCVCVLCAWSAAAPAGGAGPEPAAGGPKRVPLVLERPDDPYLPGPGGSGVAGVSGTVVFGDFVSIQANVDDFGNNVVGDAGNEPSIAVDHTAPNRLAIGWRQFDTIASNFRQAGWSYSRDGGRTWAGKSVIEPGLFRSDPVLGTGPDGTFYYSSLRVEGNDWWVDMFTSDDAGATWPDKHFAFGGDKQWFAIDHTRGIGRGNVYQAWNVAGNEYFPAQFSRSNDAGVTWESPVQYDPTFEVAFPCFGLVDVGPDGAVYVAGGNNPGLTTFWVVRSTNAQNVFSPVTFDQITTVDMGGVGEFGGAPNPAGLVGQVNIAVDHSGGPTHGNVYVLCSVNPPGPDPLDVHFVRSVDGGANFSSPVRVNDDPAGTNAWQWFGQMSVAPNGRIDVVFNDTRDSGVTNVSRLYYSSSTDAGQTWSANIALSPTFDSHLGWPQQNKLGDYYHIVSDDVGAHLAWAATFNLEQDVYYLRIGDYDCNSNSEPDLQDIADQTSNDCNANDIPDECEIAAGTAPDDNDNGILDECEACPCDCADPADGLVSVTDFLSMLGQWGGPGSCDCAQPPDGMVNVTDFLYMLGFWGPCP